MHYSERFEVEEIREAFVKAHQFVKVHFKPVFLINGKKKKKDKKLSLLHCTLIPYDCVNNKILESDSFLTAHICSLILLL